MKLMTKAIEKIIPPIGAQEGKGFDSVVYAKYMSLTGWYFYMVEYDKENRKFYGYTKGAYGEWGYTSLDELENLGYMIERDLYFTPTTLKECLK